MYENMLEPSHGPGVSLKRVFHEIKDLKFRLTRIEDEVAALHELVLGQNNIADRRGEEFNPVSSPRLGDFADNVQEPTLRWTKQLPRKENTKHDNKAVSVALMINNQAWYGEAFLFEIICQVKGHQPKENNWYKSVVPFSTIRRFSNFILSQDWFHHTCVLSVGYSEIFKFIPITDKAVKKILHNMLNHMRDHGAKRIKVLSLPPARQMMKNFEYLQLCQTNNRVLQNITEAHVGVDFINLDSFFLKNSDESFNYFENNDICIEILDNLLMKKEDEKFFIYVDAELAKCLVDYVSNYSESSTELPYINRRLKGCEFGGNNYEVHNIEDPPFEDNRSPSRKRRHEISYDNRLENSPFSDDLRATLSNKRANHRNRSPVLRDSNRNKSPMNFNTRYSPSRPEPSRRNSSSSLEIIEDNSRRDRHGYQCPVNTNDIPVERYYSYPTNSSRSRDDDRYEKRAPERVSESRRESTSPPPWIRNSTLFASTSSRLKEWYDLISDD